jgi:protein-S-isoprenylcysteine O-methyltransferase Ste14
LSLPTFETLTGAWIAVAIVALLALRGRRAAYGRYIEGSRAPLVGARYGWIGMESISAIGFALIFFNSDRTRALVPIVFFAMWELHYINRSWIYPSLARIKGHQMPISIMLLSIIFNVVNLSLNGYWLFHGGPLRDPSWLRDPRFIVGASLFVVGMAINISSDNILISLRRGTANGYVIPPARGLFRWVSCPNYLGEIVEWAGWAIATWSLAGLAFAIWTFCNLAPRALAHHRWYHERFADYPAQRRALLPFVI